MSSSPSPRRLANRRLRNRPLRNALYRAAGGRCAECDKRLPPNWHADHVDPWCRTGVTNVHGLRALCPPCNLKKGGR